MDVGALATAIGTMLALAGVGVALRATRLVRREHAKVLNVVVIYAALPALVFRVARQADLSPELLVVAGVAWAAGCLGLLVAWGLSRVFRLRGPVAGAFILVTALGNTGYIGYPVTQMVLGSSALSRAVFYDVFGTVAMLFTVGVVVAGRFGRHEGRVSAVAELLKAPALLALLAGLASRLVPLPASVWTTVTDWLGLLANMTVPLVMISLGLTLSAKGFRGRLSVIGVAAAVKLLLLPIVAVIAALAAGSPGIARLVALQAGMPTMMLTLVVAERFGLDTDLVAATILATTVACVATVPLVQMIVG